MRVVRWAGARLQPPPASWGDVINDVGRAVARILMAAALVLALVTLRGGQEASKELDRCRSLVASDLSAATADFLLATGDRVTDGDTDGERRLFLEAKAALEVARDARLAFEEHPTSECAP